MMIEWMNRTWGTLAGGAALAVAAWAACAPAGPRARPAVGPGLEPAYEDSTTLWMLAIDPQAAGIAGWNAGSWATYELGVRRPGAVVRRIRYQVLEAEARGAWIEVREEWARLGDRDEGDDDDEPRRPGRAGPLPAPRVRQFLLPFGPIERARMLEGRALDPDGGVRRFTYERRPEPRDPTGFPGSWLWVGEEDLETLNGRIRTHHYRKGATNAWVSEDAPPIGLVRAAGRGPLVNLVGWGSEGAESSIPESPAP